MLFSYTENLPEKGHFPATGAAGFSRGVRLYGKQFLSVHSLSLLRLGQLS